MDKETSTNSRANTSEESSLKTEFSETGITPSDLLNTEISSSASPIIADGSSKSLFEESIVPNSAIEKTDSKVTSIEIGILATAESRTEFENLLDSITLQTEEIEEMLDMISRAKEKLEFFVFHVEDLLKSLQEVSKHSDTNTKRTNTYLKCIYRKKLLESASYLLDKIKTSIKDFQADYERLKEQEKQTTEIFEKLIEFHRICDPCTAEIGKKTDENLKKGVVNLAEELYFLKPKLLSQVEKVSYIETDIEMLYDLHRRFSSIECLVSGINLVQQHA